MRMADGTYQWFKDKGEVSRRADGTAFRMADRECLQEI